MRSLRISWCQKARSAAGNLRSRIVPILPWGWTICAPLGASISVNQSWSLANMCWRLRRPKAQTRVLRGGAKIRPSGRVRAPAGSGVMVKAPKPGQDRRFDLPSIGPKTIEGVARARLAGIAVVAGSTIIAEPERVVTTTDFAGVFVIVLPAGSEQ